MKKVIKVVGGIIVDKDNRILCTLRKKEKSLGNMWEFPGGKLEKGEAPDECIVREIREELEADIEVVTFLNTIKYSYPTFNLTMHNFICRLKNNHISLLEHEAAKFVDISELDKVDFLPADLLILKELKEYLLNNIL